MLRSGASFAAGESRRYGAGGEGKSKAPPFSNGGKRMGHPGLHEPQSEIHVALLRGEGRQWYDSRLEENIPRRKVGHPPTARLS
jgi:hypothetical protein